MAVPVEPLPNKKNESGPATATSSSTAVLAASLQTLTGTSAHLVDKQDRIFIPRSKREDGKQQENRIRHL